jgi:pyruvate/2-oxoglutarate/acetoin dehydrogenase E1 component
MMKQFTYAEAINDALHISMAKDKNMLCYGLGINDPKNIFSTTKNLEKRFGIDRVFDVPTSENALTGVSIGAALNGVRSVVTHQRLDFFLLAMDQLVNSAAKWHYMFGSKKNVPITIRLIIGRGWGQGPTHSQNLQSWFNHIPGLKVVMPTFADDAKGLLISSIFDPNPVIFLEHRWLHNSVSKYKKGDFRIKIGKSRICKKGKDITIISMSYLTIESTIAADYLKKKYNVSAEVIDVRTIKPLDWNTVFNSIKKTGRVLVLDTGFTTGSVAGEIIAKIAINHFKYLKSAPSRMAMPDCPEPTSSALTKNFYISSKDIVLEVIKILKLKRIKKSENELIKNIPGDTPGDWFKGPF